MTKNPTLSKVSTVPVDTLTCEVCPYVNPTIVTTSVSSGRNNIPVGEKDVNNKIFSEIVGAT